MVSGSSARGSSMARLSPSPGARSTLTGENVRDGPERLLDVDVGHAGHLDREQRHARRLRADAATGRERAEQDAERPGGVGHQQAAGGDVRGVLALTEALAAPGRAQAELALDAVGVERP